MIIIDHIKEPQPLFVRKEKPTFTTKLDKERYWAEEMRRWKEGYESISGMEYFYYTQCHIRDAKGGIIRPYWRDCDHFVFEGLKECMKKGKDLFVLKRREVGLSSIGGSCLPLYFALTEWGSTSLMTSADKDRIKTLFYQKTMTAYDFLDSDIKPVKARIQQQGYLRFGIEDKATRTVTGHQAEIVAKETVENPQNFEAYRAVYGFFDEIFLHPRPMEVMNSMSRCFVDGLDKVGIVLLGGSCGESTKEGSIAGKKLYMEAEHQSIVTLFLRGTLGFKQASINGWSDEKKAEEIIMKRRAELDKMVDKSALRAYQTAYPLSVEEVLSINSDSVFPKEVVIKLSQRRIYLMGNPPPVYPHNLFYKEDGSVEAEPNKSGKFMILEHPDPSVDYSSGSDPIPFNDSDIQDGSDYFIAIKKSAAETYVAYYAERSLDADTVITNCIMLQDYYNKSKTMLERNAGGVALSKYKDYERMDLLADKPSALGIKFSDNRKKKGFYMNDRIQARGNELLIKYLLKNVDNIYFIRFIDELEDYLKKNTDMVSAVIACEIADADKTRKDAKRLVKHEYREIPTITRGSDGATKIIMKRIKCN